jgi:hypothetical protein
MAWNPSLIAMPTWSEAILSEVLLQVLEALLPYPMEDNLQTRLP